MLAANIPVKFQVPFANSGTRNVIPVTTSSTPGLASFSTGFPPITFTPLAAGGVPPAGADFNAILYDSTSWDQWFQMGGPIAYDSTFSTAIGGYPKGALISSANFGNFWISSTDGNTTNPDTGGAGWQKLFAGFQEYTTSSSISSAASGTSYISTAALTLNIPLSTTVNTSYSVTAFAQSGAITVTPNSADKINGGISGASVTIYIGQFALIFTDGSGNIYVMISASPNIAGREITTTSTVTMTAADFLIGINPSVPSAMSVNLPTTPSLYQPFRIEDWAGKSFSYPITVVPPAGWTINNQPTWELAQDNGALLFRNIGSNRYRVTS